MRTNNLIGSVKRFFKDKDGRWTVFQPPNALLSIWIILTILLWDLKFGSLVDVLRVIQSVVLVAWASMELIDGDSYFRKTLGATILIFIVFGYLF